MRRYFLIKNSDYSLNAIQFHSLASVSVQNQRENENKNERKWESTNDYKIYIHPLLETPTKL